MTKETTNHLLNETCFNPTEADERAHLARVTAKIGDALQHLSQEVAARHTEMIKLKAFLHEHKGDMDHVEKISVRQAVDQIVMTGKHGEAQRINRNPNLEPIERHGEQMRDVTDRIRLLNARSTVFSGGVVIATAHLVKGLEFDRVIVPHCTAENYRNVIDRHMLYVACTRAMHRLHLTHVGKPSSFLATTVPTK